MKLMKITKSILASLLATLLLFAGLEVIARLWFPEFSGQIHSSKKTLGMNFYLSDRVPGRVPYSGYLSHLNKPLVLILGDSISHGYGQAFEDIYWVRLQRLMQLELGDRAPEFISLSYYGNNLNDSINELKEFIQKNQGVRIAEIIYQFNFNDIVPEAYSRASLHKNFASKDKPNANVVKPVVSEGALSLSVATKSNPFGREHEETPPFNTPHSEWVKSIARWRSEYLNYSVFLRVAQHYAGAFVRKKSGNCEERGLDALGPYTWTFGSQKYAKESQILWQNFTEVLTQLVAMANALHSKFSIVVSPLLFDIDTSSKHPYYNYLNYDYSCATLNPREKLALIARRLDVKLYDPTQFMKASFDARIKEKNFSPFFFTADENHITPVASSLMADYLYIARNQKEN